MINDMKDFIIEKNDSILCALGKIDRNNKGFLVVVDNGIFIGTVTDGDIRRAFIRGTTVQDPIDEVYTKNSITLIIDNKISEAVTLFSNSRIDFLPIVDHDNRLINILTKKQLQTAYLRNMQIDLGFDFQSLDEHLLDHEIAQKPWGFYKTMVINDFYQSKVLYLAPNSSISLQRHRLREEYWMVVFGEGGVAQVQDSVIALSAGKFVFIPKGAKHRLKNTSSDETLVVVEVQLGESFSEDDIERFDDEYDRI